MQPFKDYIIGTTDIVFNDSEDFYTLIEASLDKPVQLYVYNLDTDGIRMVTLTPHKGWGGSGTYVPPESCSSLRSHSLPKAWAVVLDMATSIACLVSEKLPFRSLAKTLRRPVRFLKRNTRPLLVQFPMLPARPSLLSLRQ